MLFNSDSFLLFLLIALLIYHLSSRKYQNAILLVLSYLFYGFWNWKFCFLLLLSTIVDFICGKKTADDSLPKAVRRRFLIISVVSNLSILGVFKYYNFFADSFADMMSHFGVHAGLPVLNVVLPVGISFYTFQTMSYTIDIYRGQMKPTNSFLNFAVYVSFFPQLVAGPIERARRLLPQLEVKPPVNPTQIWEGVCLLALGYVQKVIISDQLAPLVDNAFANWDTLASIVLFEGLICFSMQIYFDFAGYSNIARGVAKFFGVDLMVNFRQPYFATSITEFWRRWHISLSTWLRDYVYIPLGGNRKGTVRTYINLMITMLLGGLWHGADYTFVVWGALHGSYLVLEKLFLSRWNSADQRLTLRSFPRCVAVFFLVLLTWVFFRAPNIDIAFGFLENLLACKGDFQVSRLLFILALCGVTLLLDWPMYWSKDKIPLEEMPNLFKAVYTVSILLVVLFMLTKSVHVRPFLYFQF